LPQKDASAAPVPLARGRKTIHLGEAPIGELT
jgi:hypothetical protein